MFDLKGRVAVITGASSGIGRDAAMAYAEQGADVAILARREEKLVELAKEITEKTGRKVVTAKCDVAKEADVKAAVEKVLAEFGKIDILLNNAGVAYECTVEHMSEEQWDQGMDVNVKSIFWMCKYVLPNMKENKYGRIVNVASVNSKIADKGETLARHVYNTSKAAVNGITIAMAASYAELNITVNAVGPALFMSEMTADTLFTDDFLPVYKAVCPAGRPGNPGELNSTFLYLSAEESGYVTGQTIYVDGGLTIV